jgi:hypothetical protein
VSTLPANVTGSTVVADACHSVAATKASDGTTFEIGCRYGASVGVA